MFLFKNGSKYVEIGYSTYGSNAGLVYVHNVHAIVDMNGSSDYIEIFARTNVSSAYIDQNATDTNVQGFKIIT